MTIKYINNILRINCSVCRKDFIIKNNEIILNIVVCPFCKLNIGIEV
jgi:hypothetical protein